MAATHARGQTVTMMRAYPLVPHIQVASSVQRDLRVDMTTHAARSQGRGSVGRCFHMASRARAPLLEEFRRSTMACIVTPIPDVPPVKRELG